MSGSFKISDRCSSSLCLRRLPGWLSVSVAVFVLALGATAGRSPVRLIPKFIKGQTMRYRIETRTTITGETTAPIANPEGASKLDQSINLIIRLDILEAGGSTGTVRLRATYEQADARSSGNGFDAQVQSLDAQYERLQGRSIQFTIAPNGQLSDFQGLEDILSNRSAADAILSWARNVSAGQGLPKDGIRVGQKWRREAPLSGSPLAGLFWRSDSEYLRNEPCEPVAATAAQSSGPSVPADNCAAILTRFDLLRHGSAAANATPEEYRRNGLRTSGRWTGAGESLNLISLKAGMLIRSTQTETQDMDYRIVSAISGSAIHRAGHVQTQTEITLLPPS